MAERDTSPAHALTDMVSVVVCARNSTATIADTLHSIVANRPHEIIVVDDQSRDGTADVARRFTERVVRSHGQLPAFQQLPGRPGPAALLHSCRNVIMRWYAAARHRRAQRALTRQLIYQRGKPEWLKRSNPVVVAFMKRKAARVRGLLESAAAIPKDARVLEVGSGSHGLIFYFNSDGPRVGVDPLAVHYAGLFPDWQRLAGTCAASGEALPFPSAVFDVVLCDNVIDHAEKPAAVVRELGRVLKLHGLLYFSVNVHHPVYRYASWIHAVWNALGVRLEITPFADHTVHLTLKGIRRMLRQLPLRIVVERDGIATARLSARMHAPRHLGDRIKRLFFKNAVYEAVAVNDA